MPSLDELRKLCEKVQCGLPVRLHRGHANRVQFANGDDAALCCALVGRDDHAFFRSVVTGDALAAYMTAAANALPALLDVAEAARRDLAADSRRRMPATEAALRALDAPARPEAAEGSKQ
jgi:hypothetical protein